MDSLEPRCLDDLRRQAVVGLHDEFQFGGLQNPAQLRKFAEWSVID